MATTTQKVNLLKFYKINPLNSGKFLVTQASFIFLIVSQLLKNKFIRHLICFLNFIPKTEFFNDLKPNLILMHIDI